ncbi:hypothetical protein BVG19_g2886 [[Candida] boidinii]|nr:hypothetical protein BVG19_g2886 [[Candida] boidinii]OWB52738.1 hypothetical protein B5S27_g4319 [[Candida] boidinii]
MSDQSEASAPASPTFTAQGYNSATTPESPVSPSGKKQYALSPSESIKDENDNESESESPGAEKNLKETLDESEKDEKAADVKSEEVDDEADDDDENDNEEKDDDEEDDDEEDDDDDDGDDDEDNDDDDDDEDDDKEDEDSDEDEEDEEKSEKDKMEIDKPSISKSIEVSSEEKDITNDVSMNESSGSDSSQNESSALSTPKQSPGVKMDTALDSLIPDDIMEDIVNQQLVSSLSDTEIENTLSTEDSKAITDDKKSDKTTKYSKTSKDETNSESSSSVDDKSSLNLSSASSVSSTSAASKTTTATALSSEKPVLKSNDEDSASSSPSPESEKLEAKDTKDLKEIKDPKLRKAEKERLKQEKKEKKAKKEPKPITCASGISTTVPITGERPRPTSHSSLEDEVLKAIFEILFDYDDKAEGMTVKQICDILIERHPDMANLSSKTSNLVSAKLNAYVKRVEKGEKAIIYSLSRDWADASPKRMVYVYRGLLTSDYYVYVQKMFEEQKAAEKAANDAAASTDGNSSRESSIESTEDSKTSDSSTGNKDSDAPVHKSNRPTKYKKKSKDQDGKVIKSNGTSRDSTGTEINNSDSNATSVTSSAASSAALANGVSLAGLELNKSPFLDAQMDLRIPQLAIPYSIAPVTASLAKSDSSLSQSEGSVSPNDKSKDVNNKLSNGLNNNDRNNNLRKSRIQKALKDGDKNSSWLSALHDSDSEGDDYEGIRLEEEDEDTSDLYEFPMKSSYYRRGSMIVKEHVPSTIGKRSKSMSFANPKRVKHVTAAGAAPRIPKHSISNSPTAAAAVAALRAATLNSFAAAESVSSITNTIMTDITVEPSISVKWLEAVRSGFLTQDIGAPEDISLSELDTLFT